MSTKIYTFDPLSAEEVAKAEKEIDDLLNRDWQIIFAVGGNRAGRTGGCQS